MLSQASKIDPETQSVTMPSAAAGRGQVTSRLSYISPNLTITGNLNSEGDIQVDGLVEGDITTGRLTVGAEGKVRKQRPCGRQRDPRGTVDRKRRLRRRALSAHGNHGRRGRPEAGRPGRTFRSLILPDGLAACFPGGRIEVSSLAVPTEADVETLHVLSDKEREAVAAKSWIVPIRAV